MAVGQLVAGSCYIKHCFGDAKLHFGELTLSWAGIEDVLGK